MELLDSAFFPLELDEPALLELEPFSWELDVSGVLELEPFSLELDEPALLELEPFLLELDMPALLELDLFELELLERLEEESVSSLCPISSASATATGATSNESALLHASKRKDAAIPKIIGNAQVDFLRMFRSIDRLIAAN